MSGTNKLAAEKNQRILLELVNQPGNDACADCKARTPRWASHNLGIFICVNCASIHRKMGTHISKVKSLTLDTWTKEQVEHMKQLGNVKCNAKYNPDEKRHPPPTNMIDSERDSELEKFIRAKYEFKTFMKRTSERSSEPLPKVSALAPSSSIDRSAAVAALLGPSRSASSRSSPVAASRPSSMVASSSTAKAPPKSAPPASTSLPSHVSQPASAPALPPRPQDRPASQPLTASASAGALGQTTFGGILANSQPHTVDATLPLQVLAPGSAPLAIPSATPTSYLAAPNPFHNLQSNSAPAFQSSFGQMTGVSPGSVGSGLGVSPSMSMGMSSSFSGTNLSPYQSSPIGGATLSSTPSPNPFSPQALPNATGVNAISVQNSMSGFSHQQQTPFGQSAATPYAQTSQTPFGQPQTPFGQPNQSPFAQPNQSPFGQTAQTPFSQPSFPGQQFSQHPQAQSFAQPQQMQYAQPQPQLHTSAPGNPYLQTPSPYMGAQQVGGSPSPYAQTQPLPQMNAMQQPQQTGFGGTNPFTSWVQQPPQQQGGYGQQWGM
ncbi:ArfGap-domain-containing protein [Phanerochaete sordida]|uniref:ArfGap-domain-containing protein n=1 Tax=Phanerochaete sordida TaxID=48140 RepID=A0A9P3GMW3_9APHY|nr:ArfGap-domain-containing protein [Phanerochaete sordida]